MLRDFLLEIGTEEIPAGFLSRAIPEIRGMIHDLLLVNRIESGPVEVFGAPRRLAVLVHGLAEFQGDLVQEVTGPPRSVAFDSEGKATKALEKFCGRYRVDPLEISFVTKEKGEYVCLKTVEKGKRTEDLLPELLPNWILSIPFPKSMRWGNLDIRFARPIRWILCIYGDVPMVFTVGDVTSSNFTHGHRFMGNGEPIQISGLDDYRSRLRDSGVILDPIERRERILKEARVLSDKLALGARIEEEENLVDTLVFLTEFPVSVIGTFEERFLRLPEEVLAASMKSHLKYLPVRRSDGPGLLPYFIAVSNIQPRDVGLIRKGMERVLRARLEDARFFFEEDTKRPLVDNLESLKQVIFHKRLGTIYDKIARIRALATYLANPISPEVIPSIERAADLCKADLVTQMVGEFPELQGIMGGIYAAHFGESREVSCAIREHYMPVSAEGELPPSTTGALLSLADKMDTVVGFFVIGSSVSGTRDPFGLRRRALGVIRILWDKKWEISLVDLVEKSLETLGPLVRREPNEVLAEVIEFYRQRCHNWLLGKGFPYDTIEAVLSRSFDDVYDLFRRIEALHRMRSNAAFEKLVLGCKRAVNILGQAGKEFGYVSAKRLLLLSDLSEDAERGLFETVERERDPIASGMENRDYEAVLGGLVNLKDSIDRLFDEVMILVDDPVVRERRLSLLHKVSSLFEGFADFSKIIF